MLSSINKKRENDKPEKEEVYGNELKKFIEEKVEKIKKIKNDV